MKTYKFIRREIVYAKDRTEAWKKLHEILIKEKEKNDNMVYVDRFEISE